MYVFRKVYDILCYFVIGCKLVILIEWFCCCFVGIYLDKMLINESERMFFFKVLFYNNKEWKLIFKI